MVFPVTLEHLCIEIESTSSLPSTEAIASSYRDLRTLAERDPRQRVVLLMPHENTGWMDIPKAYAAWLASDT